MIEAQDTIGHTPAMPSASILGAGRDNGEMPPRLVLVGIPTRVPGYPGTRVRHLRDSGGRVRVQAQVVSHTVIHYAGAKFAA
eukprot:3941143-Rhodomonas_salina.3